MRKNTNNTDNDSLQQKEAEQLQDFIGDIGNFELPDIDLNLMEFLPSDETEETRYTLPKVVPMKEDFVLYDNAQKMARELRLGFGERFDAFVSGSFIFGDFIEAYLTTQNACAKKMTISTLSMSQNNVDSLHTLMEKGYIEELNLIISVYFWGNERSSLIPYIYKQLDIGDRFQLAVAGVHTKTVHFETLGGRKIIMHGSANLRSSGNIEQFTMEENPELYEFYDEHFNRIIDKYATIRKPIRNSKAWDLFTRMTFNDKH
ncbi:hypothetical protein [Prevotella sp. 885]|uniref:hypothetical protein n=1 Tax=Prevotella sp. 885 TaxID=2022527 RepID=UPI000BA18F7B|nr:hypothetical protein [Prevotella sp. 885]OZT04979.1 hypothetical protein CHL74_01965 [Prevotella sp. 885]